VSLCVFRGRFKQLEGITSEVILIAIGGLAMSAIMLFAGWFHYHKAALN
jgi:hypothetical protein